MGELGLNKLLGALLAAALVVMGLNELSSTLFPGPAEHHGDGHHGEQSMNERLAERYAYYVEIAGGGEGGGVAEEVFDLGLALANADPARGKTAFEGKCATCHSIAEGGANGAGPNLHAIMGAPTQAVAGFSYSGALEATSDAWTYEAMNAWLENPSAYARGTSMAFAGLRRDDERANVIAYLAENTPNPPALPEPLPAETEEPGAGEAVEEDVSLDADGLQSPGLATGEIETIDAVDGVGLNDGDAGGVELVPDTVADRLEAGEADGVPETAEDVIEATQDAVEGAVTTDEPPVIGDD